MAAPSGARSATGRSKSPLGWLPWVVLLVLAVVVALVVIIVVNANNDDNNKNTASAVHTNRTVAANTGAWSIVTPDEPLTLTA